MNFQIGTFLFFDGVKSGRTSHRFLYNDRTSYKKYFRALGMSRQNIRRKRTIPINTSISILNIFCAVEANIEIIFDLFKKLITNHNDRNYLAPNPVQYRHRLDKRHHRIGSSHPYLKIQPMRYRSGVASIIDHS